MNFLFFILTFVNIISGLIKVNIQERYYPYEQIDAEILNDFSESFRLCWSYEDTPRVQHIPLIHRIAHCRDLAKGKTIPLQAFVHDVFTLKGLRSNQRALLEIIGGKHYYNISEIFNPPRIPIIRQNVVMVSTPDCFSDNGLSTTSVFRDAARRAAFRHDLPLCLCGFYNATTTFTRDNPNTEMPYILNSSMCKCSNKPNLEEPISNELSGALYDMYLLCQYDRNEPRLISKFENCIDAARPNGRKFEEVRLSLLHSTTTIDRISLKNKMWISIFNAYGRQDGALIMPDSYILNFETEYRLFFNMCQKIVDAGLSNRYVFIMKDAQQHRQHGITLKSAKEMLADKIEASFSFATQFLPNPYLVKGYKINIRRYLLLVCQKGRLRGYVHDDGKNIYSRLPYKEPWEGEDWEDKPEVLNRRLEELITSGYVPANHYDDKPLSGLEFFQYVRDQNEFDVNINQRIKQFESAMWSRLALVIHAAMINGESLCETRKKHIRTHPLPVCLEKSIRFQHFGCDFHVDGPLTGATSRVFECNKGPDMSTHSSRDGVMKRDVAADIISFMGFKGPFDGSWEAARNNNLTLIYDSKSFNPNPHLKFLREIQDPSDPIISLLEDTIHDEF